MLYADMPLVTDVFRQITSKFAAKGLRDLITISEFPHSWGQNSIVSSMEPTNHSPLKIPADRPYQWLFAN
jgi:hypothetical protein